LFFPFCSSILKPWNWFQFLSNNRKKNRFPTKFWLVFL
jgi:hypothetical protein